MIFNFDLNILKEHDLLLSIDETFPYFLIVKTNKTAFIKVKGQNQDKTICLAGEDPILETLLTDLSDINIVTKGKGKPIKLVLATDAEYAGLGFKNSETPATCVLALRSPDNNFILISIAESPVEKATINELCIAEEDTTKKQLASMMFTMLSLLLPTSEQFENLLQEITAEFESKSFLKGGE